MLENYEINEDTMAIIPITIYKTKVKEIDGEYIVMKNAYKIMDDSCKYYGSTYKGRLKAAKEMLNKSYKLPIIVEESENIIFFPTKSSLEDDCCWINYNFIKNYNKKADLINVIFHNDDEETFKISKLSLKNQIANSIILESVLRKRIKNIKKVS